MYTNMDQSALPVSSPAALPCSTTTHPDPDNPYLQLSPAPPKQPKNARDTLSHLGKRLEEGTRKAQNVLGNVYNHLRTGPSVTDVAGIRLAQGTKLLAEGGHERIFQQLFGTLPGENLKKAYVCYLSTTTGPVMGTLYISTRRIAFCSDYPLRRFTNINYPYNFPAPATPLQQQHQQHQYQEQQQQQLAEEWVYYKVVIMVEDLMTVTGVTNTQSPTEKYIKILTKDGHEFWFMGFISYDKALKHLCEAFLSSLPICLFPQGTTLRYEFGGLEG